MRNKLITPVVLEALKHGYLTEKLTQVELARIAGVSRSGVNAWLVGECSFYSGACLSAVALCEGG